MSQHLRDELADLLHDIELKTAEHPFTLALSKGTLPEIVLDRYLKDTYWAVCRFPAIAALLAQRQPCELVSDGFRKNALEELDHPRVFELVLCSRQIDFADVSSGSYRPSRLYEYLWRWIEDISRHAPWVIAVGAVSVGLEGAAPFLERVVADSLVNHYSVAPADAAWFFTHAGPVEAEHRDKGVELLVGTADSLNFARGILDAATFVAEAMNLDCPTEWMYPPTIHLGHFP